MRITKQIGIDMGHRVMRHESKCRNLHGHRYEIVATLEGDTIRHGREDGMVMDFGFIKTAMMEQIDAVFDHALCLEQGDLVFKNLLNTRGDWSYVGLPGDAGVAYSIPLGGEYDRSDIIRVIIIKETPTAENLARLWFYLLEPHCRSMLKSITVWETPSSSATYAP